MLLTGEESVISTGLYDEIGGYNASVLERLMGGCKIAQPKQSGKTDDVCVGLHGVTPTMRQVKKNAQNAGQTLLCM
jgi:hypothetical protein